MPENKKHATPRLLITALGLTAGLVLAPQVFAKPSMGYVTDAGKEPFKVSGECLTSLNEKPVPNAACGDAMEAPMETAPAPEAPKAAAPAPTPVAAAVNCDTTVNFDFDSATLKAEMKKMLDDMAGKVKASAASEKVSVVGHTDSTGPDGYNMGLSNRRAKAVSGYLADQGVEVSAVSGEGESSPVASNDTREGRAQNRRTEVSCK